MPTRPFEAAREAMHGEFRDQDHKNGASSTESNEHSDHLGWSSSESISEGFSRQVAKHRPKKVTAMTTFVSVAGICCPAEVPLVEGLLKKVDAVESVFVNVTTRMVK
eukprot:1392489-Amorphochlora_amoeboformis.AAC.1